MTARKVLSLSGKDLHQVAFGGVSDNVGYRPGEYPGVESADRLVAARLEVYLSHFLVFVPAAASLPWTEGAWDYA